MADITITGEQMGKIRGALGGFRYSSQMASPRPINDGEQLLAWLETFSKLLATATDRAEAKERKLRELEGDLAAAGLIFGLMRIPTTSSE
jgi:hypothetical protein